MRRIAILLLLGGVAAAAPRSEKRAAVEAMISRGHVVLTIDTRRDGVDVPERHKTDAKMLLEIDAQAHLDDAGIAMSLTENGHAARVVIPWIAIYRAEADDGAETAWDLDKPKDLVKNFVDTAAPFPTDKPKLDALTDMLSIREARIYLDATRTGVVVPAKHAREHDLVLRIGYRLSPAIPDLAVTKFGITGTLQFDGKPFAVRVPWAALYAAVIEGYARGVEWVADIPDELVDVGQCYPSGHATSDIEKRRACEKACRTAPAACNNLASMLVKGVGGPADPTRARTMYEQTCAKVVVACTNAGEVSHRAWGVPRDDARAVKFYTRGCDGNDGLGCDELAYLTDTGSGTAKNRARAHALYEKACDLGEAHACVNDGLDFAHADNHTRARELYAKACTADDGKGCFELGWEYEKENPDLAIANYRHGCELGSIAACNNLATRLDERKDAAGSKKALADLCKIPAPDAVEEPDLVPVYKRLCP